MPALRLAQAVQLVEQQHPVGDGGVDARCGGARRRCLRLRDGGLGLPALPIASRPAVGDLVPGDPHQPGRERTLVGPEAGTTGPRGDEDLLGDVLGVRAGPERPHRHAVDLPGPPLVGPGQRLLVARGEPPADLRRRPAPRRTAAPGTGSTRPTLPTRGRRTASASLTGSSSGAHRRGSAITTTLSR